MKHGIRDLYRVLRSIIFSMILLLFGIYITLYIVISVPAVQNQIRSIAETELSKLFGAKMSVGRLNILPFNEVIVYDVALDDPHGESVAKIEKVGAGISLLTLLTDHKIEISYAEIIGMDAHLWQAAPDAPLNIQYIIDAFKPKDKNKPPSRFDLKIRNIVIRQASMSYDKRWIPSIADPQRIDFAHLRLNNLSADIALPRLSNDDIMIDLRRLLFDFGPLSVKHLSAQVNITPKEISLQNLHILLPGSDISPDDITLNFNNFKDIPSAIRNGYHRLALTDATVTPADFAVFFPPLSTYSAPMTLSLDAVGNLDNISINRLSLSPAAPAAQDMHLSVSGRLTGLQHPRALKISHINLDLSSSRSFTDRTFSFINRITTLPPKVTEMVETLGQFQLQAQGEVNLGTHAIKAAGSLKSAQGDLTFDGDLTGVGIPHALTLHASAASPGINAAVITSIPSIGKVAFDATASLNFHAAHPEGSASIEIPFADYNGMRLSGINAQGSYADHHLTGELKIADTAMSATLNADAALAGADSEWHLTGNLRDVNPSLFANIGALNGMAFSGMLDLHAIGNTPDNITGTLSLSDVKAISHTTGKSYALQNLHVSSLRPDATHSSHSIITDWMEVNLSGSYLLSDLWPNMQQMLHTAMPSLIKAPDTPLNPITADISINLLESNPLPSWLNLPIRLLTDLHATGQIDSAAGTLDIGMQVPYFVQGRKKLIRDTYINASIDVARQLAALNVSTLLPVKNDYMLLGVDFTSRHDNMLLSLDFNHGRQGSSFSGAMQIGARMHPATPLTPFSIDAHIFPGIFTLNGTDWLLQQSDITYSNKRFEVDDFSLYNGGQYLSINGAVSDNEEDTLAITLADLNLAWLFNTLNINYVTFGGNATGRIEASNLFSSNPRAETKQLTVKNFSYNGGRLGDAILKSHWDNERKMVAIGADVQQGGERTLSVDGGIYVTRDSLSFAFDANRVNAEFIQPFLKGFCPELKGKASGWAKLYGTFRDIDLEGRLFAEDVAMKVGFTNVTYNTSDSIILEKGLIRIPPLTLRDKYGHTAKFSGHLRHNHFRDAYFNFRVSDAKRLLCLDIDAKTNPQWYGTIFGNGSVDINGRPGGVDIIADMETQEQSKFTFVLNNTLSADDYGFLKFTDRRKEQALAAIPKDTQHDILKEFEKRVQESISIPTDVMLDIRAKVTDKARLELIMDRNTGDRIIGYGNGNVNLVYTSESNDVKMYGKYIVEKGNYNFSLQDFILKDFTIKPGSSISFDGNPMDANLNIRAAYRVNTNLTDLDKSFATDRELNRTGVPVDAMLLVNGPLTHTNIDFDIELPTLTEETARKVRSIISTDDMMSRQVIYLLALNKFYTPEYMGVQSNGGEWASVASSTLSSQLSNMMGQLTDKVNILPSFRSDKGDFSDLEVDLALSSQLLNNRLLINGNFGYRDRTTSNTTFIGDFDLEYLLNRRGNIRLKAYNHFNDKNYYLKSSLTTQGLGILFRTDFDNPFRRRTPAHPDTLPSTASPAITAPTDSSKEN